MANARGKAIDKTHLSVDQAEARGFLHRDYLAHCLRWSHVIKFLSKKQQFKTARILDIGCGKEMPLIKTLHSMRMAPVDGYYIGLDINNMEIPAQFANTKFQPEIFGNVDFASDDVKLLKSDDDEPVYSMDICDYEYPCPTIITCFEVIEHVEPEHAFRILQKIAQLAEYYEATVFISTPNFDPHVGAAANHVNEMKYEVTEQLLSHAGLEVVQSYGTFASIKDYQHLLDNKLNGLSGLFGELREYYDTNVLACLLAPLFPAQSRNALWVCTPDPTSDRASFSHIPEPWSSSANYKILEEL